MSPKFVSVRAISANPHPHREDPRDLSGRMNSPPKWSIRAQKSPRLTSRPLTARSPCDHACRPFSRLPTHARVSLNDWRVRRPRGASAAGSPGMATPVPPRFSPLRPARSMPNPQPRSDPWPDLTGGRAVLLVRVMGCPSPPVKGDPRADRRGERRDDPFPGLGSRHSST